ncbi:Nucleic acid dioxygenase alkbh1, partial [Perkinsus chesapeaki]
MKEGYAEVEHALRSCSSVDECRDALHRVNPNLGLIDCKDSVDLANVIVDQNNACTINPSRSAAILLRNFYSDDRIEQITKKILTDCIADPHTTNLDPLTTPDQRAKMVEEYEQMCSNNASELNTCLLRKLRWSSLGVHYDWTRRTYRGTSASDMPQWACHLYQDALEAADDVSGSSLSKGGYRPQAALVNFFHSHRTSDRLGGHKDDVEARDQSPLVILALGLPCVFLLGGDTKAGITPAPILFNSGDVLVLSKEARQWFHGVPTILKSSVNRPHHPDGSVADVLKRTRLSVSIREVWGCALMQILSNDRSSHDEAIIREREELAKEAPRTAFWKAQRKLRAVQTLETMKKEAAEKYTSKVRE